MYNKCKLIVRRFLRWLGIPPRKGPPVMLTNTICLKIRSRGLDDLHARRLYLETEFLKKGWNYTSKYQFDFTAPTSYITVTYPQDSHFALTREMRRVNGDFDA